MALWRPPAHDKRLKLLAADSVVIRAATALASAFSALLLMSSATASPIPSVVAEPIRTPDGLAETPVTLAGIVSCRAGTELPHHATVNVTLADVSVAAASGRVLAQTEFAAAGGQMPLAFALAFDAARVESRHTYEISARIEAHGRVLFMTGTGYRIDLAAAPAAIELVLVAAA
jgi:putative lipoprotein